MASTVDSKNNTMPVTEKVSLTPVQIKAAFLRWLSDGNSKKYSPEVAVACLDRISEYIVSKRISQCGLWEISKASIYTHVYHKVIDAKLLRVMERNTYKTFTVVGQLYTKFLKEKPWEEPVDIVSTPMLPQKEEWTQPSAKEEAPPPNIDSPADVSCNKRFLFRKDVDISLLKYGFTIPQSAVESFCENVSGIVPRGGSLPLNLVINEATYPATLSNIGFSDDTRQQTQVRYSSTSPVAHTLRRIFAKSDELFAEKKQPSEKEYVEVVAVAPDMFDLLCYPLEKCLHTPDALQTDNEHSVQSPKNLTIKEAISQVLLDASRAMTVEEIYNKIIEQGLYVFGAQNPVNVVRTTIEYACDNSGYSNKDAVPSFHFERNSWGKRVYSLLLEKPGYGLSSQEHVTDESASRNGSGLEIWNAEIEQEFERWLENENYAKSTAGNYRRAAAQVFRNFPVQLKQVVVATDDKLVAVRNYISLLNEDSGFVEANASRHNQFTAALAALERFLASDAKIADDTNDRQVFRPPITVASPTSTLSNIVDLEEGKAGIREIVEAHFQTLYGYSNIGIVWNAAQDSLSLFLNDNAINTADALWRFISSAFIGEYVTNNPHIWKSQPNYPQTYVGVIINLARQFGGRVTREQIDDYFARIKQGSPINATIIRQGHLMFHAPKRFILAEVVDLTNERTKAIAKSLDKLFERERVSYIVLRDISEDWFSSLPTMKGSLRWTPMLLQEVLRLRSDISYRIVFSGLDGQALDTLGVAVVSIKSEITSFADVVHRHCYETELLGKKMPSEDLRIILRDAGMLEGNELISNLHKALKDYRFAFTDENRMVKILER